MNTKDRRHSGRYTPRATCSPKELLKYNLVIPLEYNDWNDYRDSFRDWIKDYKMIKYTTHKTTYKQDIRTRMNKKQEMLLKRREVRK